MATYVDPARDGAADEAGIRYDKRLRPDTTIEPNTATRATRGEPLAQARPRTIALVTWKSVVKGALRDFAAIGLQEKRALKLSGHNQPGWHTKGFRANDIGRERRALILRATQDGLGLVAGGLCGCVTASRGFGHHHTPGKLPIGSPLGGGADSRLSGIPQ